MSVTYKIIPIDLNRPDGSAEPVHPSVIYYKALMAICTRCPSAALR